MQSSPTSWTQSRVSSLNCSSMHNTDHKYHHFCFCEYTYHECEGVQVPWEVWFGVFTSSPAVVLMKLKPSKCYFTRWEVEYLRHIVTPKGLKANHKLVESITQFPTPTNINSQKIFRDDIILLTFAPFRELTCKNAVFQLSESCEEAMRIESEDQAYQCSSLCLPLVWQAIKLFMVEMDACIVGAVLQQKQATCTLLHLYWHQQNATMALLISRCWL